MATKFLFVIIGIVGCLSQSDDENDDGFNDFESSLGVMDWFWIVYYTFFSLGILFLCVAPCGPFNSWCKEAKYDAISDECYTEVIAARGFNASKTGVGDNRPLSLMVLRQDLKKKLVWHNDWKLDFMLMIRNEHALFSTCFVHKDHPFSKADRRAILVSVILLNFGIAMGVTYWFAFFAFGNFSEVVLEFLISYIFGLIMTLLERMRFRAEWKNAHPPPRPEETEEENAVQTVDERWKKKQDQWISLGFCLVCCPLWFIYQICCKKKKKDDDPYDDGQNEFGVNYHEYMRWKNKEDIGERPMPTSYQMAFPDIGGKINEKITKKIDGVQNTYDKNMQGIKKAQDDVKQKGKKLGNKLKMGMAIGLGKVKSTSVEEKEEEEVDLVVGP